MVSLDAVVVENVELDIHIEIMVTLVLSITVSDH